MKAIAVIAGLVAAGAVTAVVKWIFAAGREGEGGFVGPGVLIADVNLVLQILLVLGLTLGMFLARSGRIEAHRVNQTVWVLVNTALVVFVMAGSMEDVKLESISGLGELRVGLTWVHAVIGTATAVSGLWLVLQMNDILPAAIHIRGWKTLMKMTLAGYWLVALLGFATYAVWYAR